MNRPLKTTLIVIGSVFGALVVIGLIGSIVGPDEDDEPAAKPPAATSSTASPPESEEPAEKSEPGTITKADLDPWPFTVDSGVLACEGDAVTFTAGGTTYALNGPAKSLGAKDVEPIWAENPEIPGTKTPVTAAIDEGLKLCE